MVRIAAGGGPMKTTPALAHAFGEIGVLGQESIAGMQALGADLPRQRDDRVLVEIAARAFADLVRFVGEPGEQRPAVGRRMQDDRPDSHAAARCE